MPDSSKKIIINIINKLKPKTILDAPCGKGWLSSSLGYGYEIDGIDLYENLSSGYRKIYKINLDKGISSELPKYDCIVCYEGIEHFGNPLLFFQSAKDKLNEEGTLIISTPNILYPNAKLQYFLKGFFPSFPCLVGKVVYGTHMHIMPWNFHQLYLYLKLAGFVEIRLHEEELSKAKHFWEKILGIPQLFYSRKKLKKTKYMEEVEFWREASKEGAIFGRHLIVTGRKNV
jgi:2-polyprenyl-3-methyl-5-hydroxy-6-metoxy-1,4-benzoquinol methylase